MKLDRSQYPAACPHCHKPMITQGLTQEVEPEFRVIEDGTSLDGWTVANCPWCPMLVKANVPRKQATGCICAPAAGARNSACNAHRPRMVACHCPLGPSNGHDGYYGPGCKGQPVAQGQAISSVDPLIDWPIWPSVTKTDDASATWQDGSLVIKIEGATREEMKAIAVETLRSAMRRLNEVRIHTQRDKATEYEHLYRCKPIATPALPYGELNVMISKHFADKKVILGSES